MKSRLTASFLASVAAVVSVAVLAVPYLQSWGGSPFSRPDADLIFAYQALLLGDGRAQGDTSHHGFVYFLLLSWWYRLAGGLGAVSIHRLSDLAVASDVVSAFADLVVAGRMLSIVLGIAFAVVFVLILWRITRDRLVTLVIGLVFALGEGLAFQTIVLRTELIAVFLSLAAFAALLMAVQANARSAGWWLLLAGLFASLSYNSKVQILFSLLALPLLAIAFGQPRHPQDRSESTPDMRTRLAWTILFVAATPGWLAVLSKIGAMGSLSLAYVPALIAYGVACVAIYGRYFGISTREQYAAAFRIYCGFGVGLSLVFLHRHPEIFVIDANPLEHMSRFLLQGDIKTPEPARLGSAVPAVMAAVLARTWAEWSGAGLLESPHRLFLWLSAALTAVLAALRLWRPALQATLLIALASFLGGVNGVRYGAATAVYSIFVDPWILLALGVAAAAVREACPRRDLRMAISGVFLVAALVVSQRNIAVGARSWTQPAANICVQADGYFAPDIAKAFRPLCR